LKNRTPEFLDRIDSTAYVMAGQLCPAKVTFNREYLMPCCGKKAATKTTKTTKKAKPAKKK
jgi:hypothetical protein